MIKEIILVGSGGFIGSVFRYFLSKINLTINYLSIPWGTLLINAMGSLFIGLLLGFADHGNHLSFEWKMFLMVGVCGGFTTFSTFSSENLNLLQNGQFVNLILYTFLTLFFSFLFVFFGYGLSRLISGS